MPHPDDERLLNEIQAQADAALEAIPAHQNIHAIATMLAGHFPHRTVEDIEEQCKAAWRARHIFWTEL